jgi:hypothetical protein
MDEINENKNLDINDIFHKKVKSVSDMIYYMYHGGSLYKTPFWNWIVEEAKIVLSNSESFETAKKMSNYYRNVGGEDMTSWVFEAKNLRAIDTGMGYNNFNQSHTI